MAENLKNTLLINGEEYNITATHSDEAGKVKQSLTIKESGTTAAVFNGSEAATINYVSADEGGKFSNEVLIDNKYSGDLTKIPEQAIVNFGQINSLVSALKKAPLHSWENNQLKLFESVHGTLAGLNTVVGTTEDFETFKRIMGVPDLTSTDNRYYGMTLGTIDTDTCALSKYNSNSYTTVYIPSRGYPTTNADGTLKLSDCRSITKIGRGAFKGNTTIEEVIIPESVTTIESEVDYGTFQGCTNLKSIKLPSGITKINTRTFSGCTGLAEIIIGKKVTTISGNAFNSCSSLRRVYYEGTEDEWKVIKITDTNNTALTDVYTKSKNGVEGYDFIFNYKYTPDFQELPCLYICTDTETDALNKMFLKMPNTGLFIELSRGATYLESTLTTSKNSYTYEGLAEIIARINTRLDAIGLSVKSTVLAPEAPLTLEQVNELVPHVEITNDLAEEVPTIQELDVSIKNLDEKLNNDISNSLQNLEDYLDGEIDKIELLDGIAGKYTTNTVGGLSAGKIAEGTTINQLLKQILGIKDGVAPSGFSFKISPSSITAALDLTQITLSATWSVSNSGTYTGQFTPTIGSKQGSVAGKSGGTISDITVSLTDSDTSKTISGQAAYNAATGFGAGTLTSSKSLTINRNCYYGPSTGTLESTARTTKTGWTVTTSTAINNDYFVIQYPKVWGKLTSITDNDTGYEALGAAFNSTPTEITKNGGNYYEYKTINKQNAKMNFKINS